jgi:hypothetical protein
MIFPLDCFVWPGRGPKGDTDDIENLSHERLFELRVRIRPQLKAIFSEFGREDLVQMG